MSLPDICDYDTELKLNAHVFIGVVNGDVPMELLESCTNWYKLKRRIA